MKKVISLIFITCFLFTMGFILAEDIGTDPAGEIPESTNCGGTQDPDACCVNIGYDAWNGELEECVNLSEIGLPIDTTNCGGTSDPDACCVNIGYDAWNGESCEKNECTKEGERGNYFEYDFCCEGLKKIGTDFPTGEGCVSAPNGNFICSNCGNGICEEWENKCNCKEDCGSIYDKTNCGGTSDPDACCVNIGYDAWNGEDECIMLSQTEPICNENNVGETYCNSDGNLMTCTVSRLMSGETDEYKWVEGGSCPCNEDNVGETYCNSDGNLMTCTFIGQIKTPGGGKIYEWVEGGSCTEIVEEVCCKIYGYGSMMREVNVHYQIMEREDCSIPENFVGGNREIVDGSYCRGIISDTPEHSRERNGVQVQQVIQARNRLEYRIHQANGTCPENCTCDGSAMKCPTQEGGREMIIRAGNSGNTIVQVKNSEMETNVALFKADDGGVFGVFNNNETKRIILPDEASEVAKQKIQEKIKQEQRERKQIRLEQENITLNEEGYYEIQAKKRARLFWIIPVKERVQTQVDAETGNVVKVRNPWWGFLARDVRVDAEEK